MNETLKYVLPLTTSTGKARVKRRKENFGEPISVKGNNKFQKEDYIEWQISYFMNLDAIWDAFRKAKGEKAKIDFFDKTFSFFKSEKLVSELKDFVKNNPEIKKSNFKENLKEIFRKNKEVIISKEHKDNKEYVMFELADLFRLALEKKIINKKEIKELIKFNDNEKIDIEGQYKVKRSSLNKEISDEFQCFEEKYPLFVKEINGKSFVEVQLKHKQRAVGYQSMIYFCVWLKNIKDNSGSSIIGRSAGSNELVTIEVTKEEMISIAKSFIIASQDHNQDMKIILKELIKS